jgi:hypothetical protein
MQKLVTFLASAENLDRSFKWATVTLGVTLVYLVVVIVAMPFFMK